MAKQFIDGASSDDKDSLTVEDGSALTLTNSVRVLYDDTLTTSELYIALQKIQEKIQEQES